MAKASYREWREFKTSDKYTTMINTRVVAWPKEEPHQKREPAGTEGHPQDRSPRYYVDVLGKALDVLDVLRASRTDLRLTDIAEKVCLDMSSTFRLLYTLAVRGYVRRDSKTKKFRHCLGYRAYRIGYAQLSGDQPFVQKVTQGLVDAAQESGVELLVADNRNTPEQAVKNAAWLIAERVDCVIEYAFHYRVTPVLADMFRKAGIPTLAIDIPMPGAIYFGADNHVVGTLGGEALAEYARDHWRGRVDRVLLLESLEAGPATHLRIIGSLDGILRVLPNVHKKCVLRKNAKGTEAGGYTATRSVLQSLGRREQMLIAAANDNCARGALRAVREAGREPFTAIMAQGWGPDAELEAELRDPGTPLIGAVAYFPENYGAKILPLALKCLNGQPVPPATYAEHQLIVRDGLSLLIGGVTSARRGAGNTSINRPEAGVAPSMI
jgi:ribose transport system substrate-binding protein